MNWISNNKFLTALLAIVLVCTGGLGYLVAGAAARFTTISSKYDEQAAELKRLSDLPLYPSEENLKRLKQQKDEFERDLGQLKEEISKLVPEEKTITANNFQAELRERVAAFAKKAKEAGTKLPEDFYLGFEAYSSGPPRNDEAATALLRQLQVVESTLDLFVTAGVSAITAVKREPLQEESTAAPAPTGAQAKPAKPAAGGQAVPPAKLVIRSPFTVSVIADHSRIRRAINDVVKLPYFVVTRNIQLVNTMKEPPKREEEQAEAPPAAASAAALFGGTPEAKPAERLKFIVGTEQVEMTAVFEYTRFP